MPQPNEGPIAVTSNEAGERRHLVQPYAETPTVELREGVVACPFCGNETFRRSRFRFTDLLELLLLRYPVRCSRCSQRQYVGYVAAFLAFPPKHLGPRMAKGEETWRNWTAADAPARLARPLSTALEPKARKLEQIANTNTAIAPPPASSLAQDKDHNSIR